ncbi:hypothetical protein [Hymenobacter sp. YC55]|uniref:hypothetical protein n=1 Tax=Hymenobacter sp. YC55 TaxID=3034019 RepID=UPI0023F90B4A|nr:hypothetical protein [Hymenobacter sp. YC55]MDF7815459.1 hypothetical protein [Hymenobacter sp. YC55]
MRSPRIYSVLLASLTALTTPALYAQTGQTWSAIEVVPVKSAPAPATVAASGPAAALLPNAAQPAPGSRLKGDSSPLVGVLPKLIQLRPVRFKFLPGQGEEGAQYGLLPGDLARVYPELVRTNLINGVQTVNAGQLTPLLVEAVKELNAQIVVLQAQQLQLAEAYARLLEASQARPAASTSFLRRGRATDKAATGTHDTAATPQD